MVERRSRVAYQPAANVPAVFITVQKARKPKKKAGSNWRPRSSLRPTMAK
jgi:hypothetical protein